MNTDQIESKSVETTKLVCADLTDKVIGVFYDVYNQLGYGFLESVYQKSMAIALREKNLHVVSEEPILVRFRGQEVGHFFADIVVDHKLIVELKAARTIEPAHEAQVLNYLRASTIEVGLLLNFGPRPQFRRFRFDNQRKIRVNPRLSVATKD